MRYRAAQEFRKTRLLLGLDFDQSVPGVVLDHIHHQGIVPDGTDHIHSLLAESLADNCGIRVAIMNRTTLQFSNGSSILLEAAIAGISAKRR